MYCIVLEVILFTWLVGIILPHFIDRNAFHDVQYFYPLAFVATDCYPWNSCCLSADRDPFVGPCTETAIIARLPCYSRMYMVLSTYVLNFLRYIYISPFF